MIESIKRKFLEFLYIKGLKAIIDNSYGAADFDSQVEALISNAWPDFSIRELNDIEREAIERWEIENQKCFSMYYFPFVLRNIVRVKELTSDLKRALSSHEKAINKIKSILTESEKLNLECVPDSVFEKWDQLTENISLVQK